MPLNNPIDTHLETMYTAKFRVLAAQFGYEIKYENDIAAIDLGLHLVSGNEVTNTRIWFQFKGIQKNTLSKELFESSDEVSYTFKIEHLRAWYVLPEAVYIVLYIEALDIFIGEDIRVIVDRGWGPEFLNDKTFKPNQKTVKLKLRKRRVDLDEFWKSLYTHKSMRTDGKSFRGKPLGHPYNPMTTRLTVMPPELFEQIIDDLLQEHGFRHREKLIADDFF